MHSIQIDDTRLNFSAAHFVEDSKGCEQLHGHNYQVKVVVKGPLNKYGMVIDFREIKRSVKEICDRLDHKMLLPTNSEAILVQESEKSIDVKIGKKSYIFPREDCLLLPLRATTAELLAEMIAHEVKLDAKFSLEVCVSENSGSCGCFATD